MLELSMQERITHILVVDDDRRIRSLLQQYLVDQGFFVSTAEDAMHARQQMKQFIFDLLIVDVMMPGETGVEFTHSLQGKKQVPPVLMLTAMGEANDRIAGLESGAEDYLSKPFEPKELYLRVQKLVARTRKPRQKQQRVTFGDFRYDKERQQLWHGDALVELATQEQAVLSYLIKHTDEAVSRERLASHCGGINIRSIDVVVTRLRQKIEANPKRPIHLKTVWGKGYVFYR